MTLDYNIFYRFFFLLGLIVIIACQDRRSILRETVRDIDIPVGGTVVFGFITYIYESAKLVRQIESDRFVYFSDTGDMEFQNLNYQEIDGQSISMICRSENVLYTDEKKLAYLENTILEDYKSDVDVKSENLTLDLSSNFLYGKYVQIFSDQQKITGDYFKYDLLEKQIEINSNVKGTYEKQEDFIEENLTD